MNMHSSDKYSSSHRELLHNGHGIQAKHTSTYTIERDMQFYL